MFFIGGDWKNRIFSRPVKGEELTRKNMVCRSATWCKILAYIHVQFTCLWNCKTTLIQYKDNQINYYMHNINMNDMICIYIYVQHILLSVHFVFHQTAFVDVYGPGDI